MRRICFIHKMPTYGADRAAAEFEAGLRRMCGISSSDCEHLYLSPQILPKNKDPKPEQIGQLLLPLLDALNDSVDLYVPVGGLMSRLLLGKSLTLTHGLMHPVRLCDSTYLMLPIYDPGAGLQNKGFFAAFYYDLKQLKLYLNGTIPVWAPADPSGWRVEWLKELPQQGLHPLTVQKPSLVALDTEGWSHKPWGASFTVDGETAYVVPVEAKEVLRWLDRWLRQVPVVAMHNGLHDIPVLRAMGIRVDSYQDTQVLGYHEMLRSGSGVLEQESQNLGTLSYRFCGISMVDLSSLPGVSFDEETIPYSNEVRDYAGLDVIAAYRLFEHYKAAGIVEDPVYQIDMGQVALVEEMVATGMPFDADAVAEYLIEVLGKKALATEELQAMAARRGLREFNPGSHDQVRDLVTRKYGLRIRKRTKGGKASTNEKALAAHKDHAFVKRLQDFRELQKLEGTYLTPLMEALQ